MTSGILTLCGAGPRPAENCLLAEYPENNGMALRPKIV